MTAYLIVYGENVADRLAVYSYPDRVAAMRGSRGLVPILSAEQKARLEPSFGKGVGGGWGIFTSEEDVTYSGTHLLNVYNRLAFGSDEERYVKRFESKEIGKKRLMCVISKVAQPGPEDQKEEKMEGTQTNGAESTGKKTKAPKVPKVATGTRGRAAQFGPDDVITVLCEKNPKRTGSKAFTLHGHFKTGMTVKEYLEKAGEGGRSNLNWDAGARFVRVDKAPAKAPETQSAAA
jgi:hypothetical protein